MLLQKHVNFKLGLQKSEQLQMAEFTFQYAICLLFTAAHTGHLSQTFSWRGVFVSAGPDISLNIRKIRITMKALEVMLQLNINMF